MNGFAVVFYSKMQSLFGLDTNARCRPPRCRRPPPSSCTSSPETQKEPEFGGGPNHLPRKGCRAQRGHFSGEFQVVWWEGMHLRRDQQGNLRKRFSRLRRVHHVLIGNVVGNKKTTPSDPDFTSSRRADSHPSAHSWSRVSGSLSKESGTMMPAS